MSLLEAVASPVTGTGSSGRSRSQRWPGPAARASSVASRTSRVRSTCLVLERAARVETGEQQQVVDEARSSAATRTWMRSSACRTSAGTGLLVAQGEFGMAADVGDGGAQFVAGVGGEVPQSLLAGLPAGEGVLHVAEHAVERGGDLADLGARVGVRQRVRHGDLAAGQWQAGDAGRVAQ